jgi:hypothetical protein
MIGGQRRRKPHVVVHLDVERGLERVRKRRARMVEASEIGSVDGGARKKGWRKRRQALSGVLEKWGSGRIMMTDKISAKSCGFDDFIRATFAIRQFSNGAGGSVTADLDTSHDKIANSEGNGGTRCVGAFAMESAAFFSEDTEHLFGELSSGPSESKESMNIGCLIGGGSRNGSEAQIERKTKRPANGRDAANNVGAVNGAAVPSMCSSVGSFDENGGGATVIGINSNGFVEESVKAFDANGFVITTSGNVNIDAEDIADGDEKAFEIAAIIDNNETAETDLQQDFLNKETCKIMSSDVVSSVDKHEASQVTHGVQQISVATVIGDVAGGPKIDMKNVKWTAKGPGEDEFAVASDGAVHGDAMRALKHPVGNVFATLWPEESEADAVEGLVDTHVPSGRRSVASRKDVAPKRKWDDNQHEHFLVVLHWLKHDQFALDHGDAVTTNIIAISRIDGGEIRFGDGRRRGQAVE